MSLSKFRSIGVFEDCYTNDVDFDARSDNCHSYKTGNFL